MKNRIILTLSILAFNSIYAQNNDSYETDGNLESKNPLACVDLSAVTNENTPADILMGMKKCIDLKDYEKASRLFAIAGVYGKYDSYRVKDKSAHQALLVIQQNLFSDIDDTDKELLVETLQKELEAGSKNLSEICQIIRKIGIPKYYPEYMIQHGMQAVLSKGENWMTDGFQSNESWDLALKSYLHCEE